MQKLKKSWKNYLSRSLTAVQWQGWLLISVGSRGRVTAVAIWQSVGHLPDLVAAARPGNASNTSSNTRTL